MSIVNSAQGEEGSITTSEYQQRSSHEPELKENEVKYIEPQSNEMKKLLTDGIQQQIFDKKDEMIILRDNHVKYAYLHTTSILFYL